ncbi:zinc-dependent metalloprotease [Rothia sp. HC945]|uniref:zinc-dependent metalloprotease n=1 Tax=Rothia sp. HC945 TaxID=3171170 RepID=UPI0026571215|nr:zinc-dependent metalloprotease [Kocuria sp.]MDN5618133.1 zinc-dependent metalloprotease [Kocuria sp.]
MTENIISWKASASAAARVTPAGPRLSAREASRVVESVRYNATASVDHVHRITQLDAAENLHDSQVLVVDRAGWSRANAQTFSHILNELVRAGLQEKFDDMGSVDRKVAEMGTAVELGGVLSFLSSKVLGQYDPFAALGGFGAPGGRLLLVAPNIVMIERELNLEPEDFRLWVCLHEQTHRVQFAAAPWLRGHMIDLMSRLPESVSGGGKEMVDRLIDGAAEAVRSARKKGEAPAASTAADGEATIDAGAELNPVPKNRMTALLDEESAAVFSRLTGIMSLMEGHANVVMDAVDAEIVPTVKTIRRRFETRGRNRGAFDTMIRKALGMDIKMRQYRDGQRFVRHVVDERGMAQFNRIWEGPDNLPSELEIHNPGLWIDRVLDGRAASNRPADTTEDDRPERAR